MKIVSKGPIPGGLYDNDKVAKVVVEDFKGREVLVLIGRDAIPSVFGSYGIDKNNKYFYQCNSSGLFGGKIEVYDLSTGNIIFSDPSDNKIIDECKYDLNTNTISYIIGNTWKVAPDRGIANGRKNIYSFDKQKLLQ